MRRRQILKAKEATKMGIKVPNSNLISKTAPEALKEKAKMWMPYQSEIEKPGASLNRPPRKRGRPAKYKG